MKRQISAKRLHEAFLAGKLGSEDSYSVWTPLWAIRGRIWRKKSLRKLARNSLGDLALAAIDSADSTILRQMADSLDQLLEDERSATYVLKADVYYAVEDMNDSFSSFSKKDLLKWLNEEMDAAVTKDEMEQALEEMGLAGAIPKK